MIKGIFSLRNFVAKQLTKSNPEGIMKLPNKGQIDFGEMMIREELFLRGIDHKLVTSEKQLETILNTPIPTPPTPKSADVLDLTGKKIDTDKPIVGGKNIDWEAVEKTDIEDFAQGGRTGLSYLLAEATNERMPKWLGGGLSKGKRTLSELLKYMSKGSSHGQTPSEMLKMINPKQFNEMLDRPQGIPSLAKEMIEDYTKEMKIDRAGMVEHLIGTGKRIKQADDDIAKYKMKIIEDMMSKGIDRKTAENMAETLAATMEQQVGKKAIPKITDQGLLEMENIGKNLATKDRKLNATGGRVPRSGGGIMKIIKTFFQKKPETLKEFIEKRKFLEKIMGKTKEAELQKMLEEQKILQKQLEKNPPFKFPDTGPHSDISKEIEVILNKKTTKHADGGVAGMLGE